MSVVTGSPAAKLPRRRFEREAVHVRLTELCRDAILGGDFEAGDRFPSERELAECYGVSRATANKAISALVTEGLLELKKGMGGYVRERRTLFASLAGMESFTAHVCEQGLKPSTEVLRFERRAGSRYPRAVREGLGIVAERDEPVVYLERLRLAGGVPMILESRWVREALAPGLERGDVEKSFYRVLEEKFGLQMTGEAHSISAVLLDKKAADLFHLAMPGAALRVEGTGFVKGDQPLWYQRLFYRGDRYQLHNQTRGTAEPALELRFQEGDRRRTRL